ncbi:MAG TPA: hypothetical protein VK901_15340 [Nitrospiraceae bacterium]|nr:hypothetical protein [Nitrospiraceae bacterium]
MRSWQAAVLGIGCFLLVSWYSTSVAQSDDGQVLILNAATEPIRNGQLEVCGQKFPFGEIEQGKSKAIHYKVRSDSQYKLEVEFNSGKKLEKELGSVTSGLDFQDILTLNDRDVSLTR